MTEILTKLVVNCETGQREEIPLTAEEISERESRAAQAAEEQAAREAEAAAKAEALASAQAKLTALGLTEDEVNALIS